MCAYLDRLVAVGGVVLRDQANDEASPQTTCHTEEHVPVLDKAVLVLSEDTGEFLGQSTEADCKDGLHKM